MWGGEWGWGALHGALFSFSLLCVVRLLEGAPVCVSWLTRVNRGPTTAAPRLTGKGCEPECVLWDPKDGELVLGRTKPRETSVEVRRAADVQIARHIRD